MNRTLHQADPQARSAAMLAEALAQRITGDVRFDALSRTLYATDASIYEIIPVGVVWPRSVEDVVAAVQACRSAGTPLIPRGAGTGLTGGAVGSGIVLDLSRHMNHIGRLDPTARTIDVEPGVVLDELNAHLAPHRLMFAPDVATGSRATIGGMIANNACGARSIVYGRTVDHVAELTVVLSDGAVMTFLAGTETGATADPAPSAGAPSFSSGQGGERIRDPEMLRTTVRPPPFATRRMGHRRPAEAPGATESGGAGRRGTGVSRGEQARAAALERELARIRDETYDEIVRRFPKVLRSNGGYGLDRLGPPGTRASALSILCGSEGTLGIVVGAKLKLVERPRHTGLVLLHFDRLSDALAETPAILRHQPTAVELVDRMLLCAGRSNPSFRVRSDFLHGDPAAVLIVEFAADHAADVASKAEALAADADGTAPCFATTKVLEEDGQADVWNLRKAGLGLLMSRPGDAQPHAFVEDSAVDPSRLREYIERFSRILVREGVQAGYYAHASVGCIHVRPVVNLKKADNVERMRRIADAVSDLALEFGGAMTGEHGDGIVRSCWIEKMYGPRITAAFKSVKRLFDPENLLNPHKIVDPRPMTEHLRYGPSWTTRSVKTYLDFSVHGGMVGLAGMCSGVGECRKRLTGTMCPSYIATRDETHTTRARANALRVALSRRGLLRGLADPKLAEVMDLCIGCKACKTECPTGVDMARLKAEYLAYRNLTTGVSRRARFIAELPHHLAVGSRLPNLSNRLTQSSVVRALLERWYGLDRRAEPPRLAPRTFRSWFRLHARKQERRAAAGWGNDEPARRTPDPKAPRGPVVYFVDTWTNYVTPQVGVAAVTLLERAGYEVCCPATLCCGRPAISQGLLAEAKQLAEFNVQRLRRFAAAGLPILGTEPSCILTLMDEYPQLVRAVDARWVAARAMMIETFLRRRFGKDGPSAERRTSDEVPAVGAGALVFADPTTPLKYHAHCHQEALVGSTDTMALLRRVWGDRVSQIASGCCGMAGSFGYEVEHYDIARAIGEDRLFPAVRNRGDAGIAVSGFSCRKQIELHTGVRARHVVEWLADALG